MEGREYMYIPTELVEKVLLNLPLESLLRFSSVSKSWNSMIHSHDFAKRYRGREMVVLNPYKSDSDEALVKVYPLSSILSGKPMANCPRSYPYVMASCGELWCVELQEGSVCLYNPTMRTCRQLPKSPTITSWRSRRLSSLIYGSETDDDDDDDDDREVSWYRSLIYGLGYDSVTDDYKVLTFNRHFTLHELYSQRSGSWRMLSNGSREDISVCLSLPSHDDLCFLSQKGVPANGLLYWLMGRHIVYAILSFDLSTEKYGKVAMPVSITVWDRDWVDLGVLRGNLCVYIDDQKGRGVMWVLDHEGVWTKEVVINYSHIFTQPYTLMKVIPLYSYSYNNSIEAFVAHNIFKIILYEDESTQLVDKDFGPGIRDCFTYVESMVKP